MCLPRFHCHYSWTLAPPTTMLWNFFWQVGRRSLFSISQFLHEAGSSNKQLRLQQKSKKENLRILSIQLHLGRASPEIFWQKMPKMWNFNKQKAKKKKKKKHHENNRPGLGKKEVSRFLAQEASPKSTQKMQNEKKVYENSRPGLTKKQETQKVPKTAKIPKKPKNGVGARPLHSPKFWRSTEKKGGTHKKQALASAARSLAPLARSLRSPMLVFYESHPPFFLYLFKILENAVPCLFKQIFWGQGECHRRRKIFWRLLLLLLKP